jgi:hypothetical protein
VGDYNVGPATINVSYPIEINIGGASIRLPTNTSTFFRVSWLDNEVAKKLLSQGSYERNLVIHTALGS